MQTVHMVSISAPCVPATASSRNSRSGLRLVWHQRCVSIMNFVSSCFVCKLTSLTSPCSRPIDRPSHNLAVLWANFGLIRILLRRSVPGAPICARLGCDSQMNAHGHNGHRKSGGTFLPPLSVISSRSPKRRNAMQKARRSIGVQHVATAVTCKQPCTNHLPTSSRWAISHAIPRGENERASYLSDGVADGVGPRTRGRPVSARSDVITYRGSQFTLSQGQVPPILRGVPHRH